MEDEMQPVHTALTIAGSDNSGGAGIQADLKTFMAFGVYGMSVLTAVTAQNTEGVRGFEEVSHALIAAQIDSIMDDIGTDAAKTGMLASAAIVRLVAAKVRERAVPNLVVDPVMMAKSGDPLLAPEAREAVRTVLLPVALVVTPNLPEAEALTGRAIATVADMRAAARELHALGVRWVVVKGGHLPTEGDAVDVVYDGREYTELRGPRFPTKNTHGTGCTFSAAIAAGLARGRDPLTAIRRAKQYISRAIETALAIGHGHGPTNHLVDVTTEW
jgi:hydroxymethylpyrimidine/phosphomethylpyrimidine kinase